MAKKHVCFVCDGLGCEHCVQPAERNRHQSISGHIKACGCTLYYGLSDDNPTRATRLVPCDEHDHSP